MAVAPAPRARAARPPRAPGADRRAGARDRQLLLVLALDDVLLDRRADHLPAGVRLRLRLARHAVGGYDYVEFVGTGTVATAVLFSSAFPAMFGTFIKYQFQRTYDAILAAPVDTEELVTAEALWVATRAGVYGCVPLLVAIVFGLDPAWGMLDRAADRIHRRLRLGVLRDQHRRLRLLDRELQLRHQRRAHAAVPRGGHVLPAQRAAASGRRSLGQLNPLHHCVELVRHAAFGFEGWTDLARVAASCLRARRCGGSRSAR